MSPEWTLPPVSGAAGALDRLHERIAGRFARAEPRVRVRGHVPGLVAGLERLTADSVVMMLANLLGKSPQTAASGAGPQPLDDGQTSKAPTVFADTDDSTAIPA